MRLTHYCVFQVPDCYRHSPARLQPGYLSKFQADTLFYIFYSMPSDEAQVLAADELRNRGWLYHKEFRVGSLGSAHAGPPQKVYHHEQHQPQHICDCRGRRVPQEHIAS